MHLLLNPCSAPHSDTNASARWRTPSFIPFKTCGSNPDPNPVYLNLSNYGYLNWPSRLPRRGSHLTLTPTPQAQSLHRLVNI